MAAFAKPDAYVRPAEPELVEDCVRGDEAAWRALHSQYFPLVTSFLRRLGVRESDLEDAAQEVFLQVFRYLGRFRGEAEFRTWLYQLCITQRRRVRRSYFVRDALERVLRLRPAAALVSSPCFSEEAAQRRLDSALAKLPEAERLIFVLYEMEDLPGREVAKIVGANEATVWRRLYRARDSVKSALGLAPEDAS